ncbi:MAG: hypothetical protein E7388_00835 [Ruminococcaceae bacterium]|nr:hypothetical protein [Oscillospiraceae bacterium]
MLNYLKRFICCFILLTVLLSIPLATLATDVQSAKPVVFSQAADARIKPVPKSGEAIANQANSDVLYYVPAKSYEPTYMDYNCQYYLETKYQKDLYGMMVSSLANHPVDQLKPEFNITYVFENAGGELLSYDDIVKVLYSIWSDHAENFWFFSAGYGSYYDSADNIFVITIYVYADSIWTDAAALQQDEINFEKEVNKIVAAAPKTTAYDAILYFDQWLCDNNVYSNLGASQGYNVSNTAVSAILSKNNPLTGPVCQGYSTAFKYLCDKAGIVCVMILGNAYDNSGLMGAHAWNYVKLDGKWYALDITWNDSLGNKSHLLVGSQTVCEPSDGPGYDQFGESHKNDMSTDNLRFTYPSLSTTAYVHKGNSNFVGDSTTPTPTATPAPTQAPIDYKLELLDTSGVTKISSGYLEGVAQSLTKDTLTSMFKYSDHIKVLKNGNELSGTGIVGSGCVIQIVNDSNVVVEEITVVIKGDVNGDGRVAAVDYMLVKKQLKDGITITGAIFKAADIDDGGVLSTTDYMKIKRHIKGNYDFY